MTTSNSRIGRWLGVNNSVDNKLCYYVLTDQQRIIARHSVQALTEEERATPEIQDRITKFDIEVKTKKDEIIHDYSDFLRTMYYILILTLVRYKMMGRLIRMTLITIKMLF